MVANRLDVVAVCSVLSDDADVVLASGVEHVGFAVAVGNVGDGAKRRLVYEVEVELS